MEVRAMKVAILGAGLTAAYLFRLLLQSGVRADVFGKGPGTSCGVSPCAWATSREFAELAHDAGLDASDYALSKMDHILIDGFRIGVDLMTFDKQKLLGGPFLGGRDTAFWVRRRVI